MRCGCPPKWLTSDSQPITAEEAVERSCPCCEAPSGKRCLGGTSGWLPPRRAGGKRIAFVDVCPARLEVQRVLL